MTGTYKVTGDVLEITAELPDRVLASTRPDPRTEFVHRDGINLYVLEYDSGCRAASWDDVWSGPVREGCAGDIAIRWRVEGTEGLARGTIGWPSYPARTPSTRCMTSRHVLKSWLAKTIMVMVPRSPETRRVSTMASSVREISRR